MEWIKVVEEKDMKLSPKPTIYHDRRHGRILDLPVISADWVGGAGSAKMAFFSRATV